MGQPLMTFVSRRLRNILGALVLSAVLAGGLWTYDLSLRDATFASGWLLAGGVLLLTVYNLRKKLPFLPLVKSSTWLQVHLYTGWVVILLFALHTGFRLPNGALETLLWLLFVAVAGSGIVGIVLSRIFPNRMRRYGERIIFERIPIFRATIADEVRDLAMRSVTETGTNTIAQYYATRLHPYLRRPRNFLAHVIGSNAPLISLCDEMRSMERYLTAPGKEILADIESRVIAKNNLDYQHALQLVLKGWLFAHIPLTYCLIVLALVHGLLAYTFIDGAP